MKLAILTEVDPGETRVAAIPETVGRYVKAGLTVGLEAGAGAGAYIADADFEAAGGTINPDVAALLADAELVLKVRPPTMRDELGKHEVELLRRGAVVVSMLELARGAERVQRMATAGITHLAMDLMPRITRAQSMDVLSSMSTVAGYKAVLMAADALPRMCPMLMTAAGTLQPARALIVGAGVAGLQAIATAKRIGAVVTAVDVRPAVKEQIESLGAKFIPMEVSHAAQDAGGYATDLGEAFYKGEQDILAPHVRNSDLIVTTALIPGRDAPRLITEPMVSSMKPGSVIVDLAAVAGGNCTLTQPDQRVVRHGVTVLGPTMLPAAMPVHASQMYARNVATFLNEFVKDGAIALDTDNEVIAGTLVCRDGQIVNESVRQAL